MEYKDVVKFVKEAKLDLKSLTHLARIEDEFGKEAVIASLTYSVPRPPGNPHNDIYYLLQYHYHEFAASMNPCPSAMTYNILSNHAEKNQSFIMPAFQGNYQVLPGDYKYGYICCYSEMNNMDYLSRKKVVINFEFTAQIPEYNDLLFMNNFKNVYELPWIEKYSRDHDPFTTYDFGFLSILGQYKIIYNYLTKEMTRFANLYELDYYTYPFILFIKKDDFTLRFNIFYFSTKETPYVVLDKFLNFDIPYDWSKNAGRDFVHFSYNFIEEYDTGGEDNISVTHFNHNVDPDLTFWNSPQIIDTFKQMLIN